METRRSAQTAGVKAGATRRIRKIEAALTDRGVEFQPAPLSRSRGSSATPSTPEQLLADRAAWIEATRPPRPQASAKAPAGESGISSESSTRPARVRAGPSWAPPTALSAVDRGELMKLTTCRPRTACWSMVQVTSAKSILTAGDGARRNA